ncbi:APC family permease [Chloroflexota bacterium]
MQNGYRPRVGDSIIRPRRIKRFRLRRVLGVPALFSAGYGNVGSSIYYALGIVALVALGATPIVLAIAGILFIFNALTYAEGTAMLPEAGGSFSFARHAFNDTVGFIAGWALMLSYIVTMAISAYTIPPYLSHFWPLLDEPVASTGFSIGVIFLLMVLNVVGIKESTRVNIVFIILDIGTQVTLVLLGIFLILIVDPSVLVQNMFGEGNWPNTQDLIYGIAIAALCFTGVETVSQLAEETRQPQRRIPQAYILMIGAVIVLFAGISIVALSAMTPQMLGDPINGWARDPVAGIAANLPSEMLRNIFAPLVAVLAASILLTAANAGLIGISRLAFSMSSHNHLPASLGRIHPHFRTPYIAIILFCIIAFLLLIPGFFNPKFFADLGALYVFGSLLSFGLAQAAIITLRIKKPELARPFKILVNIRFRGRELPLITILAFIGTVTVWLVVIVVQSWSRWVGISWLLVGLIIYYFYRRGQGVLPSPSVNEPGQPAPAGTPEAKS